MSITDEIAAIAGDTTSSAISAEGGNKPALPPPPIDLLTCQPDELALWLNAHRFQNNAMDVASFLLTCTAALPNAEEISAHLMGNDSSEMKEEQPTEDDTNNDDGCGESATVTSDLGEALPSLSSEVSCINPRGKFILSLHQNGIMLKNPKKDEEEIVIAKEAMEHAVWFRKPEDYKSLKQVKEGSKKPIPGHMILICLEGDGVMFRNKPMKQICFQLPSYSAPSVESDEDINEEDWYNGLNTALLPENRSITKVLSNVDSRSTTKKGGFKFQAGSGASGNTSTTTAGMPFVGCNRGFNNGALFPLREGLLFFKPPLFVPRSQLASISCGRGSGQSRFVDMVVQLDDDDDSTLEFTNIEREELQGLNEFIHNVLIPAMKKDAVEGSGNNGEEDSEYEDDDVATAEVVNSAVEDSDSDESSANIKRKSSRASSKAAREATRAHFMNGLDEDDEDSDAESFSGGEDDSDGSDEDSESDFDSEVGIEDVDPSDDSKSDDDEFEVKRCSKKAKVE